MLELSSLLFCPHPVVQSVSNCRQISSRTASVYAQSLRCSQEAGCSQEEIHTRGALGLLQKWCPPAKCFRFGWVFCACAGEGRTVQLSLQVVLCSSPSDVTLAHEPEMCKDRAILPAEHDPLPRASQATVAVSIARVLQFYL